MKRKRNIVAGIVLASIALISVIFHYPIQIIDALTRQPVQGFDIHINIWRVIFEPILGPLLFYNRSIYPMTEIFQSVWWVVIIFFIYIIIKIIRIKGNRERAGYLKYQLINLPIIIGLWFTIFLIMIFLSSSFPANTIVNKSHGDILVTTHTHSQFSHDGLIRQKSLWRWHKYNNFDAFFITDHNTHSETLDFVKLQRSGKFPSDPLVMGGEEFSGSNHLSLLGLKSYFKTRGLKDSAVIALTRVDGGAVLVNHWFDGEHMTLEYFRDLGVDGFEIENVAEDRSYDRRIYHKIKSFCEDNGLIMVGGLDFHGYGNVCSLWNTFHIPGWHDLDQEAKEDAIVDVIKSRDQSKVKVLLYVDRPFYKNTHPFWRVPVTAFNYFRTLNIWQIISWVLWGLIFVVIIQTYNKDKFPAKKVLPLKGVAAALFMLILGIFYYFETFSVAGSDNDIYIEYAELLFYIGGVYFLYTAVVAYFRVFKK